MKFTKTLLSTFALLYSSHFDMASPQHLTNEVHPDIREAKERPAGIGVRLQQRTVNQLKKAMQEFLPHFITYDIGLNNLKEEWDMSMLFGLWNYHFEFTNIHYNQPTMDMLDTKVSFTDLFQRPMLKVKFPGLKHWKIMAHTKANTWILPSEADVVFDIEDLMVKFNTELITNDQGYLRPILWAVDLSWGKSKFYHENFFLAFLYDQWINFTLIIVQNSLYFMGDAIMNGMLEPPITQLLNDYQMPLTLGTFFPGQEASADFFLDLRHQVGRDPNIGNGNLDFFFLGELIRDGQNCGTTIVDNNIHFYDLKDVSQIVIGESAMTCMMNQWAKSDLSKLHINEAKFNELFGVSGYKLDTTSLKPHIKIFEEKIGANKPLKISAYFEEFTVEYGKYDVDVVMDYTVCFSVSMDLLGTRELIHDCIVMTSAANVRAENEILRIDLIEHKVNLATEGANRDAPRRNSMDMTVNEYREFLEDFSFTVSEFKKWLNDVVLRGDRVTFPYMVEEFDTYVQFEDQKMHIMLDVEDKAYQYLEEQFWKDDQKP